MSIWLGICSISEFARFSIDDQFVMIIPSNRKNDNKYAIAQRNALQQRVVTAVAMTLADNSPAVAKAPLRKSSDSAQMMIAQQHLHSNSQFNTSISTS
jgi:hypothetical protein